MLAAAQAQDLLTWASLNVSSRRRALRAGSSIPRLRRGVESGTLGAQGLDLATPIKGLIDALTLPLVRDSFPGEPVVTTEASDAGFPVSTDMAITVGWALPGSLGATVLPGGGSISHGPRLSAIRASRVANGKACVCPLLRCAGFAHEHIPGTPSSLPHYPSRRIVVAAVDVVVLGTLSHIPRSKMVPYAMNEAECVAGAEVNVVETGGWVLMHCARPSRAGIIVRTVGWGTNPFRFGVTGGALVAADLVSNVISIEVRPHRWKLLH